MTEPFGWGGLNMATPETLPGTVPDEPTELQREIDAMEAERFRLELERDARGGDD
jgi:hypothetical protein